MSGPPQIPSLKWSAQLRLSAPSQPQQRLPGDKILLPASALEQLLSASSSWAAENARKDLPEYDPYNSATHSAYRQAESQYQDQKQQLPYPLTFRLHNPENGKVVYAGIREFSAEEGEAVLSPFLLETLGVHAEDLTKYDSAMEIDGEERCVDSNAVAPKVTVHSRQLPKGTYVKLRPLEAGYDPEDWKALLEQYMRQNYTTLTNGEVLTVPGGRGRGGKKEEFRFLVDGFKPDVDGICVVDTDLEVDIEALNEEQARETLERIAAKMAQAPKSGQESSSGGELSILNAEQGQVLPGQYVDYSVKSWNRALPLEVELSSAGDLETLALLVNPFSATQRADPRLDEFVFADLSTRPRKRIRLEPSNYEMEGAEEVHVSVHAFDTTGTQSNGHDSNGVMSRTPINFSLRARHPDVPEAATKNSAEEDEVPPSEGDVRCKNCGHWVPGARLVLHEATCYRNNILCPKGCGQVFQKRSAELANHWHCPHDSSNGNHPDSQAHHNQMYHPAEVLRCNDCSTSETFANLPGLAHHRTTTCPAKLILCRFCHLVVPQEGDPDVPNTEALLSGMTPHELADGARTTECHLCNKIVRLRDMETHLRNHDLDRLSRPLPVPCRNVNCGRTTDVCAKNGDTRAGSRQGQGSGNDIGLCSVCYGPLYVSLHDPENKALRRRIERRYLQQLITGCGKAWCRNEFCKSGRRHLEMSTNITSKDALPMIKPFLEDSVKPDSGSPVHFCVDEASQKRRRLATMLAAEDGGVVGNGGYALEWCIGAVEAESGDLDGARRWLTNWAPSRKEERR